MTTEAQVPAGTDTTQAGAQAGAEGTKPEGEGAAGTPAAGSKEAEVSYEFKAPEGVNLDKARLDEFTAVAKELKLPADAAQKVVDLAIKAETARAEAHAQQVSEWAEAVKADKELGGDKLTESVATAMKAIDLGPPELKELLNASGLGNHPAVFKWAHAVGKALSEDTFKAGAQAPAGPVDVAQRLYGGSTKT
jgi:hypothetical protein